MSACVCDYDDVLQVMDERLVKSARKNHRCTECRRTIKQGESYEFVFGFSDGEAHTYKTCSHCMSLREWVKAHVPCFCWAYTMVREDALETASHYANDAPGLLFGACRREVLIRRARSLSTPPKESP
jgi:hypothetical protein